MKNNINVYMFECWSVISHNKVTEKVRRSTINLAYFSKEDRKTISRGNILTRSCYGEDTFFCTDKNKLNKYRNEIIKKNKNKREKVVCEHARRRRSMLHLTRTLRRIRGQCAKMDLYY